MPKRVRALREGFYGGARRRKGSTFILADNHKVGKWMEVLADVQPKPVAKSAAAKAKPEPEGVI